MPRSPGIKSGPGPSYLQEQQPLKTPADAFNIPAAAAPLPDHLRGQGGEKERLERSKPRRGDEEKSRRSLCKWVDLYLHHYQLSQITPSPWGPTQSKPGPFWRQHFCTSQFWEAISPSLTNFAPDLVQHQNHGP